MKFRGKVIGSGNATAIEIPEEVAGSLGPEARPPIAVAIHGHVWRSRLALMRGKRLIGVSAANRASAGIAEGDIVEVDIQLDVEPRDIVAPGDLAEALASTPGAKSAFDRLPFGLKRKHIAEIEQARSAELRNRRIQKRVQSLMQPQPPGKGRRATGED